MVTVEQLIGDLLLRHNCVIVPFFGGFVAQKIPARIDFEKGTMTPPTKSLLFNRQLVNNDGLLINEFAQLNRESFVNATSVITQNVSEWKATLKSGGQIEIDRVGRLYMDDQNTIRFEQDRFFNLLLESFGLGNVQFVTEAQVSENEEAEEVQESAFNEPVTAAKVTPIVPLHTEKKSAEKTRKETATVKTIPVPSSKRKVWKYVAAACVLPIAFYSIWIPMKTDVLESGMLSIKDFNPFYHSVEGTYKKTGFSEKMAFERDTSLTLEQQLVGIPEETLVFPYDFGDNTYVHVNLGREETIPMVEETQTPANETAFSSKKMHFIVGCFGSESNAQNLVARLKSEGLNAEIVDILNGLHRVSAGGAISEESLATIQQKAQALGFQGWILK